MLLVLLVLELVGGYVVEVNMTRRGGMNATTEVPVQYVHVPKAGGTTIERSIDGWCKKIFGHRPQKCNSIEKGCQAKRLKALEMGEWYTGHAPIGWFSNNYQTMSPLYILCNREPIAIMVSLYDYTATFNGVTHHQSFLDLVAERKRREQELRDEGVDPVHYLDTLIKRQEEDVPNFLHFYLPCGCGIPPFDDVDNATAAAMHNLLRVDVLAVLEDFDSLPIQLEYHLPWLKPVRMLPAQNERFRPKQILSDEAQTILQKSNLYHVANTVYIFSKRVADARSAHARRCRDDRDCFLDDTNIVPIDISESEFHILDSSKDRLRDSSICLAPPPFGSQWPRFIPSLRK